jgi:hypothetical protein
LFHHLKRELPSGTGINRATTHQATIQYTI